MIDPIMGSMATSPSTERRRGRPREFELEPVLDAAVHAFCERGYHGTSITDLAAVTGLTAGSLYKAFSDKDAMYLAALEHQAGRRTAELRAAVDAASSGREKLSAALGVYAELSTGARGREGCLVVETLVDIGALDQSATEYARRTLRQRRVLFADLVTLGKADGSIPRHIDTQAVAATLLSLVQGMRVLGKTDPDPDLIASVVTSALLLVS